MDIKVAKAILARRYEQRESNNIPMFRGIPIWEFDRDDVIKIATLFADEWHKSQDLCNQVLRRKF